MKTLSNSYRKTLNRVSAAIAVSSIRKFMNKDPITPRVNPCIKVSPTGFSLNISIVGCRNWAEINESRMILRVVCDLKLNEVTKSSSW